MKTFSARAHTSQKKYSERSQISIKECFSTTINEFKPLAICAKGFILNLIVSKTHLWPVKNLPGFLRPCQEGHSKLSQASKIERFAKITYL